MVYRIYVEKNEGLEQEAAALKKDLTQFLQIEGLDKIRVINRYDGENLDKELFDYAVKTVFSEPQLDHTFTELPQDGSHVFAVEYLPGQYDQRADSAAQCIQILSCGDRPLIRTAKVYCVYGNITAEELEKIKKYVINPVESREASLEPCETLKMEYQIPDHVDVLDGFCKLTEDELKDFIRQYGLAMDLADISFCQKYFRDEEHRDPTITEVRVLDTYWSDHCRHTTFSTTIDHITFEDEAVQSTYETYLAARKDLNRTKPINLMDLATLAVKCLKKSGKLKDLDESEEINACTVKVKVDVDGEMQDWLLLFKNETHNHPTEIEPFGGAATCIGGAIRDPLSGRSYVYGAMRVTGCGSPLTSIQDTLPNKLPQRKLAATAAAGYSSYGNQIGLATGQVSEIYHEGYIAKHMEVGAVIAAAPAENVRRERPQEGDIVILLGGRTGRDGCGGATGSSKSHTAESLETCGAEVQKGNAPEERKLQRLFRDPKACRMIKRCNDFGAGGVSVAIGELSEGMIIDLNAVPKKYDGLDGTELAISESQERMAVVVEEKDAEAFMKLAAAENLEATKVAVIKENPRLIMNWNGKDIVNLSRAFLDTNGAEKHIDVVVKKGTSYDRQTEGGFAENYRRLAGDLNVCSQRGLSERFDSTIGAATVMMPFGGKRQLTPNQVMVQKLPVLNGYTDSCSLMSWGFNPYITEKSPYHGAYLAVVESLAKLTAGGADTKTAWLTFQEYFEHLGDKSESWGKPAAALLGAFQAQLDYGVGAIGGKDSMSGSFEDIHVPPTLISFAVAKDVVENVITPEFKEAGHKVLLLTPDYGSNNLPEAASFRSVMDTVRSLNLKKQILSAETCCYGGIAEAVMKMAFGNNIGFSYEKGLEVEKIFGYTYGSFILEIADCSEAVKELEAMKGSWCVLGMTEEKPVITDGTASVDLSELLDVYEGKLEPVYSCNISQGDGSEIPAISYEAKEWPVPAVKTAEPRFLIPVFPGTNCEYDSARAVERAGGKAEIVVIRNHSSKEIAESASYFAERIKESQVIFIPGGFSGGDEPDGSGKFITAFFRNAGVKDQVHELLKNRDGLMCGICNGFQALIKLGLVPYGEIIDTDENCPTLTFNTIARHQSRMVRVRAASNKSPWMQNVSVGDIFTVPVSHGEGRFMASQEVLDSLIRGGQVLTQYVDEKGMPSSDIAFNPNNSILAIEGITSPDGRVLGKMGHAERIDRGIYKNVPGNYDMKLFDSAVKYFK